MKGLAMCAATATAMFVASPAMASAVLGSAADFAILGSSVQNTGLTTIVGDLGASSGTAITGINSISLGGTLNQGDPAARLAQIDVASASAKLAALPPATYLTGQDLGSVGILTPGIYAFASSAQLTGALVLDFASDPAGSFVFQIGSTLTTASASSITVLGGSPRASIYFAVGSSATLGTGTKFAGNIFADQSITLGSGATVCGRAIAENGAVTMNTNLVSNNCGGADFGSNGFDSGSVPESGTWAMLVCGFGIIGCTIRRRDKVNFNSRSIPRPVNTRIDPNIFAPNAT